MFAVIVAALDDSDEAVFGQNHELGFYAFLGSGIDLDRLPPSGWVAASDICGDDFEAGGLFEIECFAKLAVFRLE